MRIACLAALLVTAADGAHAAAITDPVGDFIPSFTGAQTPDRDVVAASASFVDGVFDFNGTFAGAAGSTAGTVYVIGIGRGQGTARFGALAPNVTFESVVIVTRGGSTVVRDFVADTVTTLSGNELDVLVPASLLPSTGFAVAQYAVNLWPHSGLANNNQIADFAPNNSNFGVTVPEPVSAALLGTGLLALVASHRRTCIKRSPAGVSAAG